MVLMEKRDVKVAIVEHRDNAVEHTIKQDQEENWQRRWTNREVNF